MIWLRSAVALPPHDSLGPNKNRKNYADACLKWLIRAVRIFSNLVKNAFDAMPEGGMLKITTAKTDDSLLISLRIQVAVYPMM